MKTEKNMFAMAPVISGAIGALFSSPMHKLGFQQLL
jgi:hypothetical protein